ncbi:hypothetical protein HYH03_010130 [Edaphochlamys debaryana]|uniref:Uncharacterized protein n=1 Tax=Edaphochlamys debaryana TaxID=47281 RepID=A0A836BWB8_9CHLO|nr:hypothetical protein HYH03_010130 [Edaphochlamys debaryana]|eukprot:KAG2491561.1 hypothetical protein HYH03_010130 [Edaphochlamys debaryana]
MAAVCEETVEVSPLAARSGSGAIIPVPDKFKTLLDDAVRRGEFVALDMATEVGSHGDLFEHRCLICTEELAPGRAFALVHGDKAHFGYCLKCVKAWRSAARDAKKLSCVCCDKAERVVRVGSRSIDEYVFV